VEAGEPVGGVGARTIEAAAPGVLSGLAARGSRVAAGAPILEVDTRGDPVRCFLIPASCDAVAREVVGHAMEVDQALGVSHVGAFRAADRGSASSAPRGPRMTVA
jgi:hypothetical protein